MALHSLERRRQSACRLLVFRWLAASSVFSFASGCAHHEPTPQEICSSKETFAQVASAFNEHRSEKDSGMKPLTAGDFTSPLVESDDKSTGLTTCSAVISVREKNEQVDLQPFGHDLADIKFTPSGFNFRMTFGIHKLADGSGSQITVDGGQNLLDATRADIGTGSTSYASDDTPAPSFTPASQSAPPSSDVDDDATFSGNATARVSDGSNDQAASGNQAIPQ